ncbi:MAG: hypothetical protein ACXADY_05180 [Candidatus Hodarchaeales archaeon]|jgi:hypothetical protein
MSNNKLVERIYCAKFTLTLNDRIMDNCAFISASSAAEAWDLSEKLASFWNRKEQNLDSQFRIHKVFKQPCSRNPIMIWTKNILEKVRNQVGLSHLFEDQMNLGT